MSLKNIPSRESFCLIKNSVSVSKKRQNVPTDIRHPHDLERREKKKWKNFMNGKQERCRIKISSHIVTDCIRKSEKIRQESLQRHVTDETQFFNLIEVKLN